MDLKVFVLFICLISFQRNYGEQPLSSCGNFIRPYKTMNNSCSNFKEVCVKKGDKECDIFQSVCKQCPLSNFSILMYFDMINIKDQVTSMKTNDMTKIGNNLIILYILVGLIILWLLLMFLEIRFKIFTKCCGNGQIRYTPVSNLVLREDVNNLQLHPLNQENTQYSSQMNSILQTFDEKIIKLEESLQKSLSHDLDNMNTNMKRMSDFIDTSLTKNNLTKFKVSGAPRPIELFIRPNENVLQVKRQICSHWPTAKPTDYKVMIIKLKCQPLNDHNNFMSYNIPTNATLYCELDKNLNPNDFVILKLQGNTDLPELLKISKDKKISELKAFIECHNNINSNPIIREMKTGQELKNEMILKNCRLQDDDWIDIITETNRKSQAISIFNESELCYVTFSNIDMMLTIKNQIISKLKLKSENIILFWNNLHLEDERYVQDYNINDEFPIKFCYLDIYDGGPIEGKNFCKQEFHQLFKGIHSKKDVYIQKYLLKENVNIIKSPSFINQLINYQIIISNPRFMSIHGIYLNKENLLVLMENKSEELIAEKIENGSHLSELEIVKLSKQILDGLKYLHDKNIVHKNLKPINIFVDSFGNVKLSCFNLIQNVDFDDDQILNVHPHPLRYWAPEILNSEPFTARSDVWSFGAVLVFLATCERPYPNLSDAEAAIEIIKHKKIEFEIPKFSGKFREFVCRCLIGDEDKRPNVDELLKDSFLH